MTLRVTVFLPNLAGKHPVYDVLDEGVYVGPSGELYLVSEADKDTATDSKFTILAAGQWTGVDGVKLDEEKV